MQYPSDVEAADALNKAYKQLRAEIGKVIIGQDEVVKFVLISIFSNGHCLLVWLKLYWYKPLLKYSIWILKEYSLRPI
jgi:hypothetical protein